MKKKRIMWAIKYREYGLYSGMWFTRGDATREHARAMGKTWPECRRSGDDAVKISVEIMGAKLRTRKAKR